MTRSWVEDLYEPNGERAQATYRYPGFAKLIGQLRGGEYGVGFADLQSKRIRRRRFSALRYPQAAWRVPDSEST